MQTHIRRTNIAGFFQCKERVILLFIFWIIGLICGLYFVSFSDYQVLEPFRWSPYCVPSFWGIMLATILPVLVSAVAVFCSAPILIYIFSILKAFSFGTCLCGIIAVFGQSGWLIRFALLFSDNVMAVVSIWLWVRCLSLNRFVIAKELLVSAAIAVGLCFVDFFLISPYLAYLMNY